MKNSARKYSILTNDLSVCHVCGSRLDIEKHEVYFGAFRNKSIEYGCIVGLCHLCHQSGYDALGNYHKGVHNEPTKELDQRLKKECQRKFEKKYGHDKFMEVFKKNYL